MNADKSISWSYTEGLPVEDETLLRARERSHELGVSAIGAATGALLSVLAASSKAQTAVEIGAGAGVSGVYLLRGLSGHGVLTSIDGDVEHLRAARESFTEAGFPANRTRTISGRAAEVLPGSPMRPTMWSLSTPISPPIRSMLNKLCACSKAVDC